MPTDVSGEKTPARSGLVRIREEMGLSGLNSQKLNSFDHLTARSQIKGKADTESPIGQEVGVPSTLASSSSKSDKCPEFYG